jgi:hypothetical protein
MLLPSRCLVNSGGGGGVHRETDWRQGIIKYAVEMGSGAMIYTRSFMKICSRIQQLMAGEGGGHRLHDDLISQNKKVV